MKHVLSTLVYRNPLSELITIVYVFSNWVCLFVFNGWALWNHVCFWSLSLLAP